MVPYNCMRGEDTGLIVRFGIVKKLCVTEGDWAGLSFLPLPALSQIYIAHRSLFALRSIQKIVFIQKVEWSGWKIAALFFLFRQAALRRGNTLSWRPRCRAPWLMYAASLHADVLHWASASATSCFCHSHPSQQPQNRQQGQEHKINRKVHWSIATHRFASLLLSPRNISRFI